MAYSAGYLLLPFELLQEQELQEQRPEKRQLRANSLCSSCFMGGRGMEGNLNCFLFMSLDVANHVGFLLLKLISGTIIQQKNNFL